MDYVVDIFYYVFCGECYICFLVDYVCLFMMYMDDVVWVIIEIMDVLVEQFKIWIFYNIFGMNFIFVEIIVVIQVEVFGFEVVYEFDFW